MATRFDSTVYTLAVKEETEESVRKAAEQALPAIVIGKIDRDDPSHTLRVESVLLREG